MRTPWGDLPVSDAHVHFFSHRFFTLLAAQKPGARVEDFGPVLKWEIPAADPAELARRWAAELDRQGLKSAVLMASLPGDEGSVLAALAACPGRFHGYFLVNPLDPASAGRVTDTLASGAQGVCLFPAMHQYSLHDPAVSAVLAAAETQPGTVVFVHCGVLSVGVRAKLGLPSRFDMRYSNPVDLHAVALRHPRLRFVLPHFGAGYLREALMTADLCPNVYLDTSSTNRWMRYYAPALTLAEVFARALDVVGPERLLFGSDSSYFPRGWNREVFEAQTEALSSLGVGPAAAAAILGGNLRRLLAG